MKLQASIKSILPPILYDVIHQIAIKLNKEERLYWELTSYNWTEAQALCTGYDQISIFEKVKCATEEVIKGNALFERDSMLFYKEDYNWPLISSLLHIYLNNKQLHVVDFGGSLGSTYYQHKSSLKNISNIKWQIVEQEQFVNYGRKHFTNSIIDFHNNMDDALKNNVDVLLFSNVLQYLEHPYELLDSVLNKNIPYILFDKLALYDKDILTIQHVPKSIYKAKYPCWFLSEEKIMNKLLTKYKLIWEYENEVNTQIKKNRYKGFLFQLKEDNNE